MRRTWNLSRLISPQALALPIDEGDYVVDTDAREAAVGVVLSQMQDVQERPVAYFSHLHTRTDVNYCTTRKELLAVVKALQQYRPYVFGEPFSHQNRPCGLALVPKGSQFSGTTNALVGIAERIRL